MKVITVDTGEYMRAHLFPCRRTAGPGRKKKMKATEEAQARYNEKMAFHKLSDKVETNFTPEDWIMTLTYDDAHLPEDPDGAMKRFSSFIRRLKRRMNKKTPGSASDLKYINIIQQGSRGGRLHHHVFLKAPGLSFEEVQAAWGQGHTDSRHLEYNEEGLRGLVEYVLEGRATVKRWTCSQNLNDPVVKDHGPFAVSAKTVRAINDHPDDTLFIENLFPGWKVARVESHPGVIDSLGLFVTIYFYRQNNAYFRYTRYGSIDYSYKKREAD